MFDSNFCNIMLLIFRHQLAALHFNENSNRDQAVTQEGTSRYKIIFPKYKRGGYVVRKVPTDPTYGEPIASTHKLAKFHCFHFIDYIEDLFKKTTEICNQGGSHVREDSPSPLCKDYEKPDKSTAIQQHRSRFSK